MRHQGFINKRQQHFLSSPSNPRPRHFYTLPKIHKSTDKWTAPGVIPPGRPIVSGCNSESANVEHFIDYHLQSIVTSIPSFIRDSLTLRVFFPISTSEIPIFFSLSMSNLFTPTYPYNKALPPSNKHSLNTFQQQRIDQTNLFLLYSNSRYSATISNLAIKHTYKPKAPLWAKNTHPPLLTVSCINGNNKPFRLLITLLYFGNATSMTFSASGDTPKINYTLLFNISIPSTPTLKVSITHNLHSINFLDCNVFKNHSKLSTKVFFKPTDTYKLLHPKSYHPAHVFKVIVKAQLLRYIRLSSHFHDFMQSYRILKSNLLNYGYTRSFIRICKQSALSLTNCQRNSMITGCQPCRSKQCPMCFYTRSTAIVASNLHNHTFPITQNTCCNTRNCIYTIHCTLCTHIPTIYVGETNNCIRSRFSQHKHNITTYNKDTVVSKHFNQTNHNLSMLRISVLQFFTENPKNSQ